MAVHAGVMHAQAKQAWQQTNLIMETVNAAENLGLLNDMRAAGRAACLSECPRGDGKPAIIIGSGASLDSIIETLPKWEGAIVCSTSHGTTLVKHGIKPTIMTCVDPRVAPDDEFGVPRGGWDDTIFVCHVSGPKEYFKRWFDRSKNMAYIFRILEPSYMWYTKHLPAIYPWVRVAMLPFIDSVASEVQIAARLGYNPLYLIGCDYGGPRFNLWEYIDGEWKFWDNSKNTQSEFKGLGGLDSSSQLMYSKKGTLIGIYLNMMNEQRKTRVYQMSLPSNIVELPYRKWEYVLRGQGKDEGEWKEGYRKHYATQIEVALAGSDTYLIPANGGYGTDYRVYIMPPEHFIRSIGEINMEILANKATFEGLEKRFIRIDYNGEMVVILDRQMHADCLPLWMDTQEGRNLQSRAKAEGGKIEIKQVLMHELFGRRLISAEHGEMIIHEAEELKDWDWHQMKLLDMEETFDRLRWLKAQSKEAKAPAPFSPPVEPAPTV